jgi:hypothetical protein
MSTHQQFVDGLSEHGEHELYRVIEWGAWDSAEPFHDTRELVEDVNEADIITSRIKGTNTHTVMLDIDHPCKLVESTTPGHYHLYIDVEVDDRQYANVLKALVDAGIVQFGFAWGYAMRKATSLRLPWVKKESVTDDVVADLIF